MVKYAHIFVAIAKTGSGYNPQLHLWAHLILRSPYFVPKLLKVGKRDIEEKKGKSQRQNPRSITRGAIHLTEYRPKYFS